MLRDLIGRNDFSYPKSPYAVLDTLRATVGHNKQALVVDFFAGSGTTLHAALLLNEIDGGSRRCVLVTNNEVSPKDETHRRGQGLETGSPEWTRRGIFNAVTRPRVTAAITGTNGHGNDVPGKYIDPPGKEVSSGFDASADFMRLRYLDPERLIAGDCFDAVHPLLWAASGCVGSCPTEPLDQQPSTHDPGFLLPDGSVIPSGCRYAVLLQESRFDRFAARLADHEDVTHVWLHTVTETAFIRMRARLPEHMEAARLFSDVHDHFNPNHPLARCRDRSPHPGTAPAAEPPAHQRTRTRRQPTAPHRAPRRG